MEMTTGLVNCGYTIVSGAAYGIDGMAHRAALASNGKTIAYLAGGMDRFHPAGHDVLLTRIVEQGAVVSELSVSSAPTKLNGAYSPVTDFSQRAPEQRSLSRLVFGPAH